MNVYFCLAGVLALFLFSYAAWDRIERRAPYGEESDEDGFYYTDEQGRRLK